MIPLNLWRAEWIKTAQRPFNQILWLIMVTLIVAFFSVMIMSAGIAPGRFRAQVQQILPFPQCLTIIAQVAVISGQLLTSVFMAQSVGSEYSSDTWKMILPRYHQRVAFLMIKMGMLLVGTLLALLTMLVIGLGLSWLGTLLLQLPASASAENVSVGERLLGIVVVIVPLLLYGSVALLVTVVTRSAVGGALGSFFGLQTIALLSPFYGPLAIVMPYPHVSNIIERWSFRDPETLNRVTQDFGYPVSPVVSFGVVSLYCGITLLAAGVIFARRDMTNVNKWYLIPFAATL